ncbi:DNA pilot protein [Microviridae sp.]|nr:DNA pilot protein [Microviridae sp.]
MPWIAAGAAIGSALLTNKGSSDANAERKDVAREQMAFQERMSNTAHQRQMADLEAAGVNPMLTAKYGGASSPGGAMPTIENEYGPAVQTGAQVYDQVSGAKQKQATTDKIVEEAKSAHIQYLKDYATMKTDVAIRKQEYLIQSLERELKDLSIDEKTNIIAKLVAEVSTAQLEGNYATTGYAELMRKIKGFTDATGINGSDIIGMLPIKKLGKVIPFLKGLFK